MDLTFSGEQDLFRRSVRDFVTDRVTPDRLAEVADGDEGWDQGLWKEAVALGLAGVSVAEEHGGAGLGFVEEAIAAEELGRGLAPVPWLGTVVLAGPALADAPDLLREIAAGEAVATLVGLTRYVVDAPAATRFLVATGDGIAAVEADDAEVRVLPTADGTRRLAEVAAHRGGRQILGRDRVEEVVGRIRTRAAAALAAEAVGVAERALETSVAYAKERQQFGKAIGSFQAVSHQLADTFMDVELSRSLALWAALAIDALDDEADLASWSALAAASEGAIRACERAIQCHGGIGFTWVHVLHRYYKRARWIASFLDTPSGLRARIASSILD